MNLKRTFYVRLFAFYDLLVFRSRLTGFKFSCQGHFIKSLSQKGNTLIWKQQLQIGCQSRDWCDRLEETLHRVEE